MVLQRARDREAFFDAGDIDALRNRLAPDRGARAVRPCGLDETLALVRAWRVRRAAHHERRFGACRSGADRALLERALLRGSAPFASVLGACLQGLSAPGVFEDSAHLRLLALLADDVGVGRAGAARGDAFRLLLRRFGLEDEDTSGAPAADRLFALPAVILAMSRRSDRYGPELCALDLVLRAAGMPPCWAPLAARYPDRTDWTRLDLAAPGERAVAADPLALACSVLAPCVAPGHPLAARTLAGLDWARAAVRAWDDELDRHLDACLDARRAMEDLVQRRARAAALYHQRYRLDGCPLSERFRTAADSPGELVAALARSPLVKPASASASVLVNGLVAPHGKMFRVFDDAELAVIRRWIDALPAAGADGTRASAAAAASAGADAAPPAGWPRTALHAGPAPRDLREAYFLLQGRSLAPGLRRFALDYVGAWMRAARRGAGADSLPPRWPHDGLRAWLDAQHERAGHGFENSAQEALPARAAVVDSTLQLAPLLCIDGAWLQGFTDIELAAAAPTHALFEIYWDELGNGQYELNHPKIYRDLLRQMGIELAPTGSRAFAQDRRLRDAAFRLPVLWLCLGKLPSTFLPEILGMNLAMELSGVGGGYRAAHRFLARHGFSTRFVDLHNTIDNVASGHAGKAAQAVDRYMRMQYGQADPAHADAHWARVGAGYRALTRAPGRAAGWLLRLRLARRAGGAGAPLHHDRLEPAPVANPLVSAEG